ncbi:MAG: rhomboid family intramembrane serine protease [Alphaproteobacteria bacterium]|jgi:membrane associated rhomboid family serine protease|nr:rhomboid family intramembrane serine protease [Alphaproteobacteria bacterium]PPR13131.1 MAG: hypothetical protein CFH42_01552 [Alphaproteobacteria bacterium MarineAlpha12_Bin1]|tara:strand:+ start:10863 stop:11549 length:687 start_codon:yes stop_codon:yes gene_type:complete
MPFLPLYDSNPRINIKFHYVTISLLAINLFFFIETINLVRVGFGETLIGYTLLPARLFGGLDLPLNAQGNGVLFSLISYQFLHGGWQHLLFNMLFLWVFGDNIEDKLGHSRFILYYLVCGIAGGLLHSLVNPTSLNPTIGASGAIAGILGGYLLLYPRARLLVLAFGFIPVRLPSLLVIGAFFAQDLIWGITGTDTIQGVAVWAHIGGFICGGILIFLLTRKSITKFN